MADEKTNQAQDEDLDEVSGGTIPIDPPPKPPTHPGPGGPYHPAPPTNPVG